MSHIHNIQWKSAVNSNFHVTLWELILFPSEVTCKLFDSCSPATLSLKRNATFLRGFFLGPRVRVITPDSPVYTLLQKKGNFQNVAFLLRKSVALISYFPNDRHKKD